MMKFTRTLFAAAILAAVTAIPVFGQPAANIQAITPMSRDTTALLNLAAVTSATSPFSSADQSGFNVSRVICFYNQTSSNSTVAPVISIQNKDAVSLQYYNVIAVNAPQVSAATVALAAGAGITGPAVGFLVGQAASNVTSGTSIPVSRNWRVRVVHAGGTTGAITGTIGCSIQ